MQGVRRVDPTRSPASGGGGSDASSAAPGGLPAAPPAAGATPAASQGGRKLAPGGQKLALGGRKLAPRGQKDLAVEEVAQIWLLGLEMMAWRQPRERRQRLSEEVIGGGVEMWVGLTRAMLGLKVTGKSASGRREPLC